MPSETVQGTRLPDLAWDERNGTPLIEPSGYRRTQHPDGSWHWYCCTPNDHHGNLDAHDVTEHGDGTITVSPSILISGGAKGGELWHGWLERGVWRSC